MDLVPDAERLALYRDLGVLPYENWDAFYADLSAPGVRRPRPTARCRRTACQVIPPPPPTTSAPSTRPGKP